MDPTAQASRTTPVELLRGEIQQIDAVLEQLANDLHGIYTALYVARHHPQDAERVLNLALPSAEDLRAKLIQCRKHLNEAVESLNVNSEIER